MDVDYSVGFSARSLPVKSSHLHSRAQNSSGPPRKRPSSRHLFPATSPEKIPFPAHRVSLSLVHQPPNSQPHLLQHRRVFPHHRFTVQPPAIRLHLTPFSLTHSSGLEKENKTFSVQFSSVAPSCLTLCNPMNPARQASLCITNSQSSLKRTSIKWMMPSSHLILCRPLVLLPQFLPASGSFPMSQLFA